VNAVGIKDIDSTAISIGGGFIGAAGSVSIWAIGTAVTAAYEVEDGDNATANQQQNTLSPQGSGDGNHTNPQLWKHAGLRGFTSER
jgi:hypothetical protein